MVIICRELQGQANASRYRYMIPSGREIWCIIKQSPDTSGVDVVGTNTVSQSFGNRSYCCTGTIVLRHQCALPFEQQRLYSWYVPVRTCNNNTIIDSLGCHPFYCHHTCSKCPTKTVIRLQPFPCTVSSHFAKLATPHRYTEI